MPSSFTQNISFGDCDPAGIVFYPNIFRWMDAASHHWFRAFGGHAAICTKLNAVGLGLVDASAQFKSPLRDGDLLVIRTSVTNFGRKTLALSHQGYVGDTLAFSGSEVRCLFQQTKDGMVAGDLSALREILEA